jgi:deoxyribodipyrimidine photo-lyase
MTDRVNVFWFRRDLRLQDNAGLYHALRSGNPVVPLFIFDTAILDDLEDKHDRRVEFIHHALQKLQAQLNSYGTSLLVKVGRPADVWNALTQQFQIEAVFANRDYEPYARERDRLIGELLREKSIAFHTFKDQVIFEGSEVLKDDGSPYTVFTPYSHRWKTKLTPQAITSYSTTEESARFYKMASVPIPTLTDIGFHETHSSFPSPEPDVSIIKKYDTTRNFPGIRGTSRLSLHLRFGTISIRDLVRRARSLNEVFLNELIWREFYMMILWHFPHVVHRSFKPEYDRIEWRNEKEEFQRWCEGMTGFPIVDAGMRELNTTGYMHNRVRMIVASFLTKDLLIDWRWGEAYFAKKLLDFELSSNNGGWQWSAGTGCDAAPYFRIFNPHEQTKKFDPEFAYIRQWVPEWNTPAYPRPIVDHAIARTRCLRVYKAVLDRGK